MNKHKILQNTIKKPSLWKFMTLDSKHCITLGPWDISLPGCDSDIGIVSDLNSILFSSNSQMVFFSSFKKKKIF